MRRLGLATFAFLATIAWVRTSPAQIVPGAAPLAEAAQKAIDADWLTEDERHDLRIEHGVWDARDLTTAQRAATAASIAWDLENPALSDATVPAALRAAALLRRGRFDEVLTALGEARDPESVWLRAEALNGRGEIDAALDAARSLEPVLRSPDAPARDIVAAARAAILRGRLEGLPSASYQLILDALGRARADDRLSWAARLAEGELLAEKHNAEAAVPPLHEALALNPRCGEAWYRLGLIAAERFDFGSAERAARALDAIRIGHPLASLLRAEAAITRRDPDLGADELDSLLAHEPSIPLALALRAAADAARFDEPGVARWLARLEEVSPGGALGYATVGRVQGDNRQYAAAAATLEEAIRRRPAWSEPRIQLGMLETQTGRDDRARDALRQAIQLDPFDKRAQFSRFLLDELAGYERLEGKHFVVRYKPGIDRVVAAMMPPALDAMHDVVAERFAHSPARKTIIDLMPDHAAFGVRITGMPQIHTIAACTGPVIAIEVPREGPPSKHQGLFDWLKVLRHEYTHTVTLDQTRNRIPHWLTEAAAVSMENVPRSYGECQMLARELASGGLFDLDAINLAFVRPKRPHDRALAYAQGHWMVQFMDERFGKSALLRLLEQYDAGVAEKDAMPNALGVSRDDFSREFLVWARDAVRRWGLAPEPSVDELLARARERDPEAQARWRAARAELLGQVADMIAGQIGAPGDREMDMVRATDWPTSRGPSFELTDEVVAGWLRDYPDHPDVLEVAIRRRLKGNESPAPDDETLALLERYAAARPVDPYPHRLLARMYLATPHPEAAIPHLRELDVREESENAFALELTRLLRAAGQPKDAFVSAQRAARIDPFDPATRELAAAVAVEAGELAAARTHIEALTLLEPERPQHRARLERIDELLRAAPNN